MEIDEKISREADRTGDGRNSSANLQTGEIHQHTEGTAQTDNLPSYNVARSFFY
jgi:hypothetical protein